MYKLLPKIFVFIILCYSSLWVFAQDETMVESQSGEPDKLQAPAQDTQQAQSAIESIGSIQVGTNQARLSDNNSPWNDVFVRGNVNLGSAIGILNWDASNQKHFNETGQAFSFSLTHQLNADWYGFVGAGVATGANFLPKRRIDLAINRKWLEQRQLVTGLQFTGTTSGDGNYRDQAWQLSSTYYFTSGLVSEIGLKRTTSNPGDVNTLRYFGAATYGVNKKYYLSARYDTGREGYQPQGSLGTAFNFKSSVATVTWRQWVSPKWGYEVQAEHYKNTSYRRNGLAASIFRDF
jgi:YaiO family outer membrane protein